MQKVKTMKFLVAIILFMVLLSSSCRMRKKNRCNSCPKWTEETIKSEAELNRSDV